jgi:hypothetical protein
VTQELAIALFSRATTEDKVFAQAIIPEELEVSCMNITSAT